jgi:hypothetical protein
MITSALSSAGQWIKHLLDIAASDRIEPTTRYGRRELDSIIYLKPTESFPNNNPYPSP